MLNKMMKLGKLINHVNNMVNLMKLMYFLTGNLSRDLDKPKMWSGRC